MTVAPDAEGSTPNTSAQECTVSAPSIDDRPERAALIAHVGADLTPDELIRFTALAIESDNMSAEMIDACHLWFMHICISNQFIDAVMNGTGGPKGFLSEQS